MKKIISAFILLTGTVLSGCKDSDTVPEIAVCPSGVYKVETTTLSLYNHGEWNNTSADIILIRSEADYEKYAIEDRDSFPKIDFNENTLVLIQSEPSSGVFLRSISMGKWEDRLSYLVIAEIQQTAACVMTQWKAALLAPAIPEEAEVTLSVIQI